MTAKEALELARGYASVNRVSMTGHARTEARLAGAQWVDVVHALAHGHTCGPGAKPERWRIVGPDVEGKDLALVVVFEDGVVVVTVF